MFIIVTKGGVASEPVMLTKGGIASDPVKPNTGSVSNEPDSTKEKKHTYHPQDWAWELLKLVWSTPAWLHCSQTEITDLNRQILMQENILRQEVKVHPYKF